VERRLTVNARAAGPRIGKSVQQAIAGAKSGDWSESDGVVTAGGIELEPGEYELVTVFGGGSGEESGAVLPDVDGRGGFVLLNTALTPELEAEGYARDLIRLIQDERKSIGLNVGDRISLTAHVPLEHVPAVQTHKDLIAREVLATSFEVIPGKLRFAIEKV
jgi:isoleucyl-tRNA synthetase